MSSTRSVNRHCRAARVLYFYGAKVGAKNFSLQENLCGFSALVTLVITSLVLSLASPRETFSAGAPITVRVGYPQPSGAQLPLWVMSEAKLDRKYGVDLQNIYISAGAVINAVLSVADHPKAAAAEPKDFFDNRFIKELEDTGFIKELYGQH